MLQGMDNPLYRELLKNSNKVRRAQQIDALDLKILKAAMQRIQGRLMGIADTDLTTAEKQIKTIIDDVNTRRMAARKEPK